MNLKDRLITPEKKKVYVKQMDDSEISDIFINNNSQDEVISQCIVTGRNFLITGSFDCDKSIVEKYIKKFEIDNKNMKYCGEGVKGLNAVFENVIAGKNFNIAYFDLSLYDDVLKNIKLLMSVNMPNLQESKIDYILKTVNPVIVHASKDEDGLFFIKSIGELADEDNNLFIKSIYPSEVVTNNLPQNDETLSGAKNKEEILSEVKPVSGEIKKVNKYKLLKEKIHRKNSQ